MDGSGEDDVRQDVADAEVVNDNEIISCVKMKLASFCPDPALRAMMNSAVLRTNNIVGETYAFANFHITRLLSESGAMPSVDRKFYYACLACVSTMNVRESTLTTDLKRSRDAFDALRPEGSVKIDARDLMDLLPDISITMATMATNHLWMNLCGRLSKYLKWKRPDISTKMRKTVVMMVAKFPTMPLDKVDELSLVGKSKKKVKPELAANLVEKRTTARSLIVELRARCPIKTGTHVACRAHLLIPFFHFIQQETEAKVASQDAEPSSSTATRPKVLTKKALGRFTLLPTKRNYTVSCIPISKRFMFALVTRLKRSDGTPRFRASSARGTKREQRLAWETFCNVNAVETRSRKFRDRIVTDGVSVAVIMNSEQACVQSNQDSEWDPSVLPINKKVNFSGVDPGVTDIFTATIQSKHEKDRTVSYSSSRYYERSKVKLSGRRTTRWNKEMGPQLRRSMDQSTVEGASEFAASYLSSVRELHEHRATKGYRNMRFMRYVFKQKAIQEICDLMAPPDEFTVVGFGDWSGPNGTPIKRRFAGPLQDIKRELKRRTDSVAFRPVWEYRTSVLNCVTWERMENMAAKSWKRGRDKVLVERKKSKIHKVMHCKTSVKGTTPDITTWDRDVNASKNILMLMMREIRGLERPSQFKPTQLPSRPVRVKVSPGSNTGDAVAHGLSLGSS